MSHSPPGDDNGPEVGDKRPATEPDTDTPDPNIKVEPDVKKQKIDNEVPDAIRQPLKIVDIDPEGDLTIIFRSKETGFKFDSNALKRTSPILYQRCLTVRPADGSAWTFEGVPAFLDQTTEIILNVIHTNADQVPESMRIDQLYYIVNFAKRYGMKDRLAPSMKRWFFNMQQAGNSNKTTKGKLRGLWITNELGLDAECKSLQSWAVYNLTPCGQDSIGDLREIYRGVPVNMKSFSLYDFKIIDRVVRLRSEAVDMIIKNLNEVQLAMVPLGDFEKDGRIHTGFGGHACSQCLDLWLAYLWKSLLRPQSLNSARWQGFPSLSQVIEANEYLKPLEELCTFIGAIQLKMDGSVACSRKGQWACVPPQLAGRAAVQYLINQGLAGPIGSI